LAAYDPSEWSDLFVAAAGASAALTGLVFVAVSINLDRILKIPGLPDRALQTLLMLLSVLVFALVGLFPGQGRTAFGLELTSLALLFTLFVGITGMRSRPPSDAPVYWVAGRVLLGAVATLPLLIGGISILSGTGGGLYWIAAGIIFAVAAGVSNAWVLLVEILR
jgi:hypothetical protein